MNTIGILRNTQHVFGVINYNFIIYIYRLEPLLFPNGIPILVDNFLFLISDYHISNGKSFNQLKKQFLVYQILLNITYICVGCIFKRLKATVCSQISK